MQRAILQVLWGPLSGRKAAIEPGKVLRVGRTVQADVVVPCDTQMSGLHFELGWDGTTCRVRDLKSRTGTLVGGERIERPVDVSNGEWIRAGNTDFSVHFEGASPRPWTADEVDEWDDPELYPEYTDWVAERRQERARENAEVLARRQNALRILKQERAPLFAVLDAARDGRILVLLRESIEEYRSLYEGVEGETLSAVAPYLVGLPHESALLEQLVMEGWEKRWGIYLSTAKPFKEVRRHLRRFLMIEDPDTRERFYFRFYDPGVLRDFIPTCSNRQRGDFFGEIQAFCAEGELGEVLRFDAGGAAC